MLDTVSPAALEVNEPLPGAVPSGEDVIRGTIAIKEVLDLVTLLEKSDKLMFTSIVDRVPRATIEFLERLHQSLSDILEWYDEAA
jgi:hypothetical protein